MTRRDRIIASLMRDYARAIESRPSATEVLLALSPAVIERNLREADYAAFQEAQCLLGYIAACAGNPDPMRESQHARVFAPDFKTAMAKARS